MLYVYLCVNTRNLHDSARPKVDGDDDESNLRRRYTLDPGIPLNVIKEFVNKNYGMSFELSPEQFSRR